MKIGIVNVARLLDESKRGKAQGLLLKSAIDKWQAQLLELAGKLERARQALGTVTAATPPDVLFKLQHDARLAELDLQRAQEVSRLEIEGQREQARAAILRELDVHMTALAKEKGLSLVHSVPSREIVFAAADVDLTAELLARYDATVKP